MIDRVARAEDRFREGFSCAQSVFSAFAEEILGREAALRTASSFGAGMARRGDTCGAVTGALMVLGLLYGRTEAEDTDAKELNYLLANRFIDRFEASKGSRICRELLGFDPGSEEGRRRLREDPELGDRCTGYVREAAAILAGIIASDPSEW
jgi:C_GCAxxG_C_C family probable redox protein